MRTACGDLTSLEAVNAAPDLADDTFLLAMRGLKHCPPAVLLPDVLPPLLDAAQAGLLVQHRCPSAGLRATRHENLVASASLHFQLVVGVSPNTL